MKRFAGKTCVVTASTQGIGYAIAERFAKEGGKVFISSRKDDAVKAAVLALQKVADSPDHVAGCVCHVNKAEQRANLFQQAKQKFGAIHVLVLNAAASTHFGSTLATSERAYDSMFQTNVKSTFLLAQESQPYLAPSSFAAGGFSTNILLVGSIGGYVPGAPIGIYGVTKTAMIGLTKALAKDFSETGVRVNCLAPGVIRTSFAEILVDAIESKQKKGAESVEAPAAIGQELDEGLMKRVGEPDEMGAVAAFLCSSDASFITGEVTVAAGGVHARL